MIVRLSAIVLVLSLVACGGAPPAQSPGRSPGAGQPTTEAQPPTGAPVGGDVIDGDGLRAAVDALTALDSFTFDLSYIVGGGDNAFQFTVSGTERRTPERAVDATHGGSTGEFHYIRIGDDIWVDLGNGQYAEFQAGESENLVSQYEPYHLIGLMENVTDRRGEYELVGDEVVHGTATRHYRLSQSDREDIVQTLDIAADRWAGDAWIASQGGYLVQFAWGAQTVEDATPLLGFTYAVTSVNCACPVQPPN